MTLLLIRHGPTRWNEERRLQGRADIPLSEAGARQVAGWRLPGRFHGLPVKTSPLLRVVKGSTLTATRMRV